MRPSLSFARLAMLAGLGPLAAAFACSPSSSGSSGAGPADASADAPTEATVTCADDARVDSYAPNLVKASASGHLKVTLVSSDPVPPSVGTNTWKIHVADGAGAPMAASGITIASFMPDHGHGSSVKAVITDNGNGDYTVTPLYLFMPGVWRITFALPATDAAPAEQVQFFFCVAG
jgi:hypothetical protein